MRRIMMTLGSTALVLGSSLIAAGQDKGAPVQSPKQAPAQAPVQAPAKQAPMQAPMQAPAKQAPMQAPTQKIAPVQFASPLRSRGWKFGMQPMLKFRRVREFIQTTPIGEMADGGWPIAA